MPNTHPETLPADRSSLAAAESSSTLRGLLSDLPDATPLEAVDMLLADAARRYRAGCPVPVEHSVVPDRIAVL